MPREQPPPLQKEKPHPFRELSQGPPPIGPPACSEQHEGQQQGEPWHSTRSSACLRSHVLHPGRRGSLLPGVVLCHNHIGVPLRGVKPHLDAAPAAPAFCGVFVGVGPDLLTQIFGAGEDLGEGSAHGAPGTAIGSCCPVPALVPVLFACDVVLAVLPPFLAVLFAQWHMQNPLPPPAAVSLVKAAGGLCAWLTPWMPCGPSSPQHGCCIQTHCHTRKQA